MNYTFILATDKSVALFVSRNTRENINISKTKYYYSKLNI